MTTRIPALSRAALVTLAFAPAVALAQMSCDDLGAYLATQPHIQQYVAPNGVVSPLVVPNSKVPQRQ